MKVKNMIGRTGKSIANQFIITDNAGTEYFQSYGSIIVKIEKGKVFLDSHYWDYSSTTGKHRNQFLGETKHKTQKKIDSGEYTLTNLNN